MLFAKRTRLVPDLVADLVLCGENLDFVRDNPKQTVTEEAAAGPTCPNSSASSSSKAPGTAASAGPRSSLTASGSSGKLKRQRSVSFSGSGKAKGSGVLELLKKRRQDLHRSDTAAAAGGDIPDVQVVSDSSDADSSLAAPAAVPAAV